MDELEEIPMPGEQTRGAPGRENAAPSAGYQDPGSSSFPRCGSQLPDEHTGAPQGPTKYLKGILGQKEFCFIMLVREGLGRDEL